MPLFRDLVGKEMPQWLSRRTFTHHVKSDILSILGKRANHMNLAPPDVNPLRAHEVENFLWDDERFRQEYFKPEVLSELDDDRDEDHRQGKLKLTSQPRLCDCRKTACKWLGPVDFEPPRQVVRMRRLGCVMSSTWTKSRQRTRTESSQLSALRSARTTGKWRVRDCAHDWQPS